MKKKQQENLFGYIFQLKILEKMILFQTGFELNILLINYYVISAT